ncbi:hypothetical protein J6590_104510 [Homalodisca vitripennis]|nr:hypothetical protein J6590_104510 [Homalodisca vitripennis]
MKVLLRSNSLSCQSYSQDISSSQPSDCVTSLPFHDIISLHIWWLCCEIESEGVTTVEQLELLAKTHRISLPLSALTVCAVRQKVKVLLRSNSSSCEPYSQDISSSQPSDCVTVLRPHDIISLHIWWLCCETESEGVTPVEQFDLSAIFTGYLFLSAL